MKLRAALALLTLTSSPAVHAAPLRLSLHTGTPGQTVSVAADFGDWQPWKMREPSPGEYEYSCEEPLLPRVQYKFIVDGKWLADPANPRTAPDGQGGVNSVLELPDFEEDPMLAPQPGAVGLREEHLSLQDWEGAPRDITVLSPAQKQSSVTVYFQDGGDYLSKTGVRALMANLMREPGFPAMTGVFIPPKDRTREYTMLPGYADWVAQRVVQAVEARWPLTGGGRARRLLVGDSLGGLISLYTALRHPAVFGNVASQSGAFWPGDSKVLEALAKPVTNESDRLKLYMDCGTYEDPDMPKYNRLGQSAAQHAGHDVRYREYPSTHDWIAWRNRLQGLLRHFFDRRGS
jgi:enterochelin esterase-like enzyme